MNLPFERNNYYNGKLLTAGDFQSEQLYHSQKLQLINRLALGKGVLIGMEVFVIDDKTVMVGAGAGIDALGRIVVVRRPVTQKLALIKGFKYDRQSFYLCIELSETGREESNSLENVKQYNRIIEDSRLFLTEIPPAEQREPQSLDDVLDDNSFIYLTEISVVCGEGTYFITGAEDARSIINSEKTPEPQQPGGISKELEATLAELLRDNKRLAGMQPAVASGIERIDFGLKAKRDRCFYTEEIVHGLGKGFVSITLGVINTSSANAVLHERTVTFGEQSVFDGALQLAARVNSATGTFVIGVRLPEDTLQNQVTVHWTAVKDNACDAYDLHTEYSFSIQPAVAELKCGELRHFETGRTGTEAVIWRVVQDDGGAIDRDGLYRAPDSPGIYEVQAQAGQYTAAAFVIVR